MPESSNSHPSPNSIIDETQLILAEKKEFSYCPRFTVFSRESTDCRFNSSFSSSLSALGI